MSKHKTFYLVDGSSYIFRAFFGVRQLSTSKGFPTNALYGFINMLQKVIREEKPDYLVVAFDSPDKTFRHKIYPDYKANREAPPEELAKQFPYFEPLVQAYGLSSVRRPGFEADDIIGTLAKKGIQEAKSNGNDVVIIDTAGRLHIDEKMMGEIAAVKKAVQPHESLLRKRLLESLTLGHVPS